MFKYRNLKKMKTFNIIRKLKKKERKLKNIEI